MEETEEKRNIIEVDKEFMEVLKRLEVKIIKATWDGMEKVSSKVLTRVLARKILAAKLV